MNKNLYTHMYIFLLFFKLREEFYFIDWTICLSIYLFHLTWESRMHSYTCVYIYILICTHIYICTYIEYRYIIFVLLMCLPRPKHGEPIVSNFLKDILWAHLFSISPSSFYTYTVYIYIHHIYTYVYMYVCTCIPEKLYI